MRILGIDPGYGIVGFGVVDRFSSSDVKYVGSGCIKTHKDASFASRLEEIVTDLTQIVEEYSPDLCAVEQLFFAKNTKTALKVAEARGVIIYTLHKLGLPIYEYTPLQIKQALTGDGRAMKSQVQQMVEIILNVKDIKGPDDTLDALAVGLTYGGQDLLLKGSN